jgi:methylglutaconyl-CoA hydratase
MSELIYEVEDGVAFLTLNRPEKRNALNDALIKSLKDELRKADGDESLRVIVIRGAGKDFCSGADLAALQKISENSRDENLADARNLMELYLLIRQVRIPVIAAVHGRALAGGCGLATACDIVLATESARFGYPEVKIGFVPAMVTAILRRNLGEKRSFELLTQGFEFSSREAENLGLVNKVFVDESFESAVKNYSTVYAKVSRSAVVLTKNLLYGIDGMNIDAAMEKGAEINATARETEDCKKGIARFLNKT